MAIHGYTKSHHWGKRHLKMHSFTHTILLLVAHSADK